MTMTSTRIACVVDFSSSGTVALAQALVLAERRGAPLDVLHIPGRRREDPRVAVDLHTRLVALVADANAARVPTSVFVLSGRAVSVIAEHVEERPADLLVVGPAPRGTIFRSRGRFAAAVARRAGCPVITLPKGTSVDDVRAQFRRIVCAVDGSLAAAGALQMALHLAQQSGSHLTVLHVVDGFPQETVYSAASVPHLLQEFDRRGRAIVRRLRELVPPDALPWGEVDYRLVPGVAHRTIASVATAQSADLVVVGRPPQSWLGALGSTGARILARSACPVLTVPGPPGLLPDVGRTAAIAAVERFRAATPRQRGDSHGSQRGTIVNFAAARQSRLRRQQIGVTATTGRTASSFARA
ncbi:universal stress protein [Luteitalea sp.]